WAIFHIGVVGAAQLGAEAAQFIARGKIDAGEFRPVDVADAHLGIADARAIYVVVDGAVEIAELESDAVVRGEHAVPADIRAHFPCLRGFRAQIGIDYGRETAG